MALTTPLPEAKMLRILLSALLACCLATPIAAQTAASGSPQCGHEKQIVGLADVVLARRDAASARGAHRFGASAAYLKVRYGALAADGTRSLLAGLLAKPRRPYGIEDLAAAWLIATAGYGPHLAMIGDDYEKFMFGPLLMATMASALRSLVIAGQGELLVQKISGLDQDRRFEAELLLATIFIDLPDESKQSLAAIAEGGGLGFFAASLYAGMSTGDAWTEFAKRNGKDADRFALLAYATPAYRGRPFLQLPPSGNAFVARFRQAEWTIARAMYLGAESVLLANYGNLTGGYVETEIAARRFIEAIEAGELNPIRTPERGWLLIYEALVGESGDRAAVDERLATLTMETGRHYAGKVRTVLDWVVAVDAISPFARGEVAVAPFRPHRLSSGSKPDWTTFVEVADTLRARRPLNQVPEGETATVTAELLLATDRIDELVQLIARIGDADRSIALAEDFARRLDRRCKAHLVHPGASRVFLLSPIFRFE